MQLLQELLGLVCEGRSLLPILLTPLTTTAHKQARLQDLAQALHNGVMPKLLSNVAGLLELLMEIFSMLGRWRVA